MSIDWSSFYKKEDWWAIWLAFLFFGLTSLNLLVVPKIGGWDVVPSLTESTLIAVGCLFVVLAIIMSIYPVLSGVKIRDQMMSFVILFAAAFLSLVLSKQNVISKWGLEYVIWALLIGLVIGNFVKPSWLVSAAKTEIFIKTGLVLLGAEILLSNLLAAGLTGVFEVTIGLCIVWYFCYFLALRMGLSRSFASIMASATSICGVSAAIAAGGAVKGDPKEVSYTISLVLLFAMPMLILMPWVGRILNIADPVVGAWIGGTIDTTPAVVAAGALYSEKAMQVASIVKMSQNMMIAVAAFILAVYWSVKVDRRLEKPTAAEIWFRFPKFVLGFIVASVVFSLMPSFGLKPSMITATTSGLRGWLFSMAFVSIGINTNFRELAKTGGGKPLIVFLAASLLDTVVSLASAYVFFGGTV